MSTAVIETNTSRFFDFNIIGNKLTVSTDHDFINGEIEIDNLKGQKVFSGGIVSETAVYDLSLLPVGFYFLTVGNEKLRGVKKFVLVK